MVKRLIKLKLNYTLMRIFELATEHTGDIQTGTKQFLGSLGRTHNTMTISKTGKFLGALGRR